MQFKLWLEVDAAIAAPRHYDIPSVTALNQAIASINPQDNYDDTIKSVTNGIKNLHQSINFLSNVIGEKEGQLRRILKSPASDTTDKNYAVVQRMKSLLSNLNSNLDSLKKQAVIIDRTFKDTFSVDNVFQYNNPQEDDDAFWRTIKPELTNLPKKLAPMTGKYGWDNKSAGERSEILSKHADRLKDKPNSAHATLPTQPAFSTKLKNWLTGKNESLQAIADQIYYEMQLLENCQLLLEAK